MGSLKVAFLFYSRNCHMGTSAHSKAHTTLLGCFCMLSIGCTSDVEQKARFETESSSLMSLFSFHPEVRQVSVIGLSSVFLFQTGSGRHGHRCIGG